MIFNQTQYNPLEHILNYFPTERLTKQDVEYVKNCLLLGGVQCETDEEVIECINLLSSLGVLKITPVKENRITYYKVENNYGK